MITQLLNDWPPPNKSFATRHALGFSEKRTASSTVVNSPRSFKASAR